jgi:hypothetical protein
MIPNRLKTKQPYLIQAVRWCLLELRFWFAAFPFLHHVVQRQLEQRWTAGHPDGSFPDPSAPATRAHVLVSASLSIGYKRLDGNRNSRTPKALWTNRLMGRMIARKYF